MSSRIEQSQRLAALETITGLKNNEPTLPKDFLDSSGIGGKSIPVPAAITVESSLDDILIFARGKQASDVHLSVQNPVIFRQFGFLKPQTKDFLTAEHISQKIQTILKPHQYTEFIEAGDLEMIYTIDGAGRFRVTLSKQRLGWDFTARVIPTEIFSFEQSKMPLSCAQLTKWAQGLVLVTGPASCGKTTTLATLVEMINQTRDEHIITIENPIEIVYTPKHCQITQREINRHTLSQTNALRAALREDPDIIVVSELRDYESIQLAVTAAETGHLVFGTMNTNNAYQTIFSLINSFPADEQTVIANMISESLRGIISQQLIPTKDGTGVTAAYEVLIQNSAISSMIREGKYQQINNTISTSKSSGMVLLDQSLLDLVQKGIVDKEEACLRAISPAALRKSLSF